MFLQTLIVIGAWAATAEADTIQLTIPDTPPSGVQTLDGSYQGYSMELASFANIAGNHTSVHSTTSLHRFLTR